MFHRVSPVPLYVWAGTRVSPCVPHVGPMWVFVLMYNDAISLRYYVSTALAGTLVVSTLGTFCIVISNILETTLFTVKK